MQTKFVLEGEKVRIRTDFDGGALARAVETDTNQFDCWPYAEEEYVNGGVRLKRPDSDVHDGANFAFLCRLEGCRSQPVTLRFHIPHERQKEGDCPVVYANPDFPVYSYDGCAWHRTDRKERSGGPGVADEQIVTVRETFTEDTVWLSFQYPYTNDHLADWIGQAAETPFLTPEVVGASTQGRPIRGFTIADPAASTAGRKSAWFIGLQHPAETGAGWGLEGMAEFLLSDDPEAAAVRSRWAITFVPIVNVDAIAEGRGRIHTTGVNLNREWEKPDPVREVLTIKETLRQRARSEPALAFFADIHGFSSRDGKWTAPVLEETTYPAPRRQEDARLKEALGDELPGIRFVAAPCEGYAAGFAGRELGALSICVDGWVFGYEGAPPDLASHYESGDRVEALSDMKAAGAAFIRALSPLS
jgi:hypothetical protein